MIVTIDGPAGSGKSTAARGLASRLGFEFLDTGAMYRALALALNRAGIDYHAPEVEPFLGSTLLEIEPGRVRLNGEDVTPLLRTPLLSSGASKVAAVECVRHYLVEQQRRIALGRDMVCEGRDQGTVVFPEAQCKFFLVASPQARARRRLEDLLSRGHQTTLEVVLQEQEERDHRDSSRRVGALRPADDAIHLDTSDLSIDEVLHWMEQKVRSRWHAG